MKNIKLFLVAGARPNFMKIAPLVRAFASYPQVIQIIVHTGQHYDKNLSHVFFDELGIPEPNYNLGVGSGQRDEQCKVIASLFDEVLQNEQPDAVIVVGDVNSTLACARAAKNRAVSCYHVEAGLRSFDLTMPEELNRIETDQLCELLFVTEQSGMKNLEQEGLAGKASLVGNVMIDTLIYSLERIKKSNVLEELAVSDKEYIVCTIHRPSNVDTLDGLQRVITVFREIAERKKVVLPLHPRSRASLVKFGLLEQVCSLSGVQVINPLGYFDFMKLIFSSVTVVTDSGGIQEEASYLGIPCLTMRENTERPVTIELGTNLLVGSDWAQIKPELERILAGNFKQGAAIPYWDGKAAERIAGCIVKRLG